MANTEVLADNIIAFIKSVQATTRAEQAAMLTKIALLETQIVELKAREPLHGKDGAPGAPGERGAAGAMGPMGERGERGESGKDGKDVDPFVLETLVETRVGRAIAAIPTPTDGKDGVSITVDAITPLIVAEVQKAVAALPPPEPGKDGKSFDPEVVDVMVAGHVTKAMAAIPIPKDGRDGVDGLGVTVDDVAPLVAAEVSKAVSTIPPPRDGVGVVGTLIDRDGHLIVTLSDGATKDVGVVVGKDVDPEDVHSFIREELAKWPRPKDGADGLGFDDLDVVFQDGRAYLRFVRGDRVKEFLLHVPNYRKGWKDGDACERGDMISQGNQIWIAEQPTTTKPEDVGVNHNRKWTLSLRRPRDGKEGPPGPPGRDGLNGRPGRDLTNLGPDGSKWGD